MCYAFIREETASVRTMGILCVGVAVAALLGAGSVTRTMLPMAAGVWYPVEKDKLVADGKMEHSDDDHFGNWF
jgi:hypothetical protein